MDSKLSIDKCLGTECICKVLADQPPLIIISSTNWLSADEMRRQIESRIKDKRVMYLEHDMEVAFLNDYDTDWRRLNASTKP